MFPPPDSPALGLSTSEVGTTFSSWIIFLQGCAFFVLNNVNRYPYFNFKKVYIHRSAEDVVAHCLQQGEDAEAHFDGDDQGAGSLYGLSLLLLDITQESLQEVVTCLNLMS